MVPCHGWVTVPLAPTVCWDGACITNRGGISLDAFSWFCKKIFNGWISTVILHIPVVVAVVASFAVFAAATSLICSLCCACGSLSTCCWLIMVAICCSSVALFVCSSCWMNRRSCLVASLASVAASTVAPLTIALPYHVLFWGALFLDLRFQHGWLQVVDLLFLLSPAVQTVGP